MESEIVDSRMKGREQRESNILSKAGNLIRRLWLHSVHSREFILANMQKQCCRHQVPTVVHRATSKVAGPVYIAHHVTYQAVLGVWSMNGCLSALLFLALSSAR